MRGKPSPTPHLTKTTMICLSNRLIRHSAFALCCLLLGASTASAQEGIYKKLPGKCRIASSFGAGGPGFLPQATDRTIRVAFSTSYTAQGGNGNATLGNNASACGLPADALAIVVSTSVVPRGQAGTLKVFENGKAVADGNSVAFNAVDAITNDMIVPLRARTPAEVTANTQIAQITINSSRPADYVLDVVGYFKQPVLSCVNTAEETNVLPAGDTQNTVAPPCSSGYFETATICGSTSWDMPMVYQGGGICSAKNNGTSNAALKASRRCCQIR